MKAGRRLAPMIAGVVAGVALMQLCACAGVTPTPVTDTGCDLVVFTTTDMHGKCWERNILTDVDERNNMLRVSTALQEARDAYGDDNVILIDNGDLFQGTPVSEVHLLGEGQTDAGDEAMALCLKDIGYDALVLGNHEFTYGWDKMRAIYDDLQSSGVAVLAANVYWDGSDGAHDAGAGVFDAWLQREVSVGGHPHKVGILGLTNTDIPRWEQPTNYPGMAFASPDNPGCDMAWEANRYLREMDEAGCELMVVSYHAGLGDDEGTPTFGVSTENQGLHIIENTDCIDLMVLGHDHTSAYSNTFAEDKASRQVPIVNGGSRELTKTVFHLTEDPDGRLVAELVSTENLNLADFEPDHALEDKVRPYADEASAAMEQPIGVLGGQWDASRDFFMRQTDTMDLVLGPMIDAGTQEMAARYDDADRGALEELGLDHTDVDAAIATMANRGYTAHTGNVSRKDVFSMFVYANRLSVIPMTGRELKAVMEENAVERLSARVIDGKARLFAKGDIDTLLIFGGIDFRYDMFRPEGDRVLIDGFSNGRPFEEEETYLVTVISYVLGNDGCGLRRWTTDDALWSQQASDANGFIQDRIAAYVADRTERHGAVTADMFDWEWSVTWSGDVATLPPYDGPVAASLAAAPQDGHRYVLYHEAEGCTMAGEPDNAGSLATTDIPAHGNDLTGTLPDEALVLTAEQVGGDTLMLRDRQGRYLTCRENGGLELTEEAGANERSVWRLVPTEAGCYVVSVGATGEQALQCVGDRISTRAIDNGDWFTFNLYEVHDR